MVHNIYDGSQGRTCSGTDYGGPPSHHTRSPPPRSFVIRATVIRPGAVVNVFSETVITCTYRLHGTSFSVILYYTMSYCIVHIYKLVSGICCCSSFMLVFGSFVLYGTLLFFNYFKKHSPPSPLLRTAPCRGLCREGRWLRTARLNHQTQLRQSNTFMLVPLYVSCYYWPRYFIIHFNGIHYLIFIWLSVPLFCFKIVPRCGFMTFFKLCTPSVSLLVAEGEWPLTREEPSESYACWSSAGLLRQGANTLTVEDKKYMQYILVLSVFCGLARTV